MPIVIQPTPMGQKMMNKKMDKMGGGGMDIGKDVKKISHSNDPQSLDDIRVPYRKAVGDLAMGVKNYADKQMKKKMKMSGKMEDMREYMDVFNDIEEEVEVDEGKGSYKNMMIDIEDGMDKEEFEKEYPGRGDLYDEIKQEIIDRADETIETEEDCGCDDEAVDAMVSVPVQDLQDILQLAGYENYAEKIQEYANEPEEEYSSVEDQLIGLSGGLNGPKKMYPASADGDNPMNQEPREVEETMEAVEEKLYKSYKDFLEEAEDAK